MAALCMIIVYLMIIVAIIGFLFAVTLPRYLAGRVAAAAGSAIGDNVALAKEYAEYLAT